RTDLSTGKHTLALEAQQRPMTVQDLLRHTSGLIYPDNGDGLVYQEWQKAKVNDRGQPLSEMVSKMAKLPLAHQPGQVWEYSMSTDVLGGVVELVSGKDLDVFIAERIAKPLGMASTDFYVHEPDLSRLAEAQRPPTDELRMPPDVTKKPVFLSGGG